MFSKNTQTGDKHLVNEKNNSTISSVLCNPQNWRYALLNKNLQASIGIEKIETRGPGTLALCLITLPDRNNLGIYLRACSH